jgi:hypothetical protein
VDGAANHWDLPREDRAAIPRQDRDAIYGDLFQRRVDGMDIREVVAAPSSRWQIHTRNA